MGSVAQFPARATGLHRQATVGRDGRVPFVELTPTINDPPAVFAGYAEHHIGDDPLYQAFTPHVRRRQARPNRGALLLDRHDQRQRLIVPFVRPGRHDEFDEPG